MYEDASSTATAEQYFHYRDMNPQKREKSSIIGTSGVAKEVKQILATKEQLGQIVCEQIVGSRPQTRAVTSSGLGKTQDSRNHSSRLFS